MARALGIGGVFLRARDAERLRRWYHDALGIDVDSPYGVHFEAAVEGAGLTFSIFENDSTYIGDPERQGAMVNFVVDDLDAVIERVQSCGAPCETIQGEEYGRFSWSTDPEGNRLELWEPPGVAP
ncbi:MAG: VOC family protein [Acidimicrobiales bacterium]